MTDAFPMVDVVQAIPLEGFRIRLRFSGGSEGDYDLSEMIAEGGEMIAPLTEPEIFRRVFVEMGVLTWPNGFDLDPINLYMELRTAGALKQSEPASGD
jgi:hypothetical protein